MQNKLNTILRDQRLWAVSGLCLTILTTAILVAPRSLDKEPTASATVSAIVPAPYAKQELSDEDIITYRAIFRAQEQNDWDSADRLMATLNDQRLLGTVLADRYLGKNYKTTADELSIWLSNFADQPEAERIAALATKKGAEPSELAELDDPLKGIGYVETIGSKDMPARWYRGLSLWRSKDYAGAAKAFADAADTEKLPNWQRASAHFWHARALEKTGQSSASRDALKKASEYPLTFYGMLANAKLDNALRLSAQAPYVPAQLRTSAGFMRAEALSRLGEISRAESELRHMYRLLGEKDRAALITLASEINLPNLQVRLSRLPTLNEEEEIFAAFPMPQWLSEEQASFDAALMYSISRQESSFSAEARSHAGATGLMQLMPTTANYIWKKSGEDLMASMDNSILSSKTSKLVMSDLHDPKTNLLLGQEYLHYLMKSPGIGGNLVHILAGYNAGPGMAAVWNKSGKNIDDPLLYIESIPYGETRRYVMQVMANYWVYQTLMGHDTDSLDGLANGQWPVIQNGNAKLRI